MLGMFWEGGLRGDLVFQDKLNFLFDFSVIKSLAISSKRSESILQKKSRRSFFISLRALFCSFFVSKFARVICGLYKKSPFHFRFNFLYNNFLSLDIFSLPSVTSRKI